MSVSSDEATLIAAVVAAVSGMSSVALTIAFQRGAEFRAAHRKLMEAYLEELGKAIHESLATTSVFLSRVNSGENPEKWRKRAEDAKTKLGEIRRRVRYSLWGIDSGLRELTRLSSWVSHLQKAPDRAQEIFDAGEKLRKSVDNAIRFSYKKGKPPSIYRRWAVAWRAWQLRNTYKQVMAQDLPKVDEDEPV